MQATSRRSVMATIPLTYSFSISPQPADVQTPIILPTVSEGYKSAASQTVLVSNTGTGDTGEFTLSLVQASLNYFSLSKATMASLAVGKSDSFTVTPNTGLAPGTYQDFVQISCSNTNMQASDKNKGFLIEFTVVESVTKDIINLSPFDDKTFATKTEGYSPVAVHTVDVSNTGTEDTGELTVSLSGTNADSFTLSKTTITNIAANGSENFTVVPKTGLPVGTYTATVTVSGDTITPKNFDVFFTVEENKDVIILNPFDDKTFSPVTVGYSPVTAYDVNLSNTGTRATGELTVSLSGTNADSFTLSKTTIASLEANGSNSFSVVPKTGLAVGTYTATVTVSGDNITPKSFNISFTVEENKDVIILNPFDDKTFSPATVGYSPVTAYDVNLSNTGTRATGELTVSLSGTNADSFMLSKTTIASLTANGSDNFTVVPKTGLAVGTYTATVTVSGNNIIPKSFDVSFTVKINPPTATGGKRTVTVKDVTDGATLKLYKPDGTIVIETPTKNPDGTYTYTNVEPGNYYVTQTINGIESGHSNTAMVTDATPETPSAPTAKGGKRTVTVKDVKDDATLKLYKADGTIVTAIPTKNLDGTYTYTDLEPGTYYVTQTSGGVESDHSNTVTVTPEAPIAPTAPTAPTTTGGTKTITVKDVKDDTTFKLYKADGTIVTAIPTKNPDGTYTYTDLEPGTYYVTQTSGGVESDPSNTVTVTPEAPIAPTTTGGTRTITVKDVTDGATLNLYKSDGTLVNVAPTKNLDGFYTYIDLELGVYYVTQTVDGVEGGPSGTFSVTENDDNNFGADNGTDSGKPSTDNSDNAPKTGDSVSVALLIGLLSLSLLIISLMLKRRRQNS
ncbi:choice-of-anchor D domain-containing protein [[Clostridium] fimetarium]|uniref:choice-of-anchor D domain-containing protein n=1 Tax=[Clostridium] fimetarium TaxID=99656 RepID=UPI00147D354A|nr:choice-of-anchor D domain-containing protein [[Clostridium] fimetarium]